MKAYLEIEMPKNCNGCPLHFYEGQGICSCCVLPTIEDDEILKPWKNKRKDCPLVPVPPHGRCIDADALDADLERQDMHTGEWDAVGFSIEEIESAPTILPASKEGET